MEAYSHTDLAGLAADCRRRAALTDNREAGAMLRFMAGEYEDRAIAAARTVHAARVTI